jgi:ATP-dependent DNA helicase RecG
LLPTVHDLAERLLSDAPDLADRIVRRWIGGAVRYASA